MDSCRDCIYLDKQIRDDARYEFTDIGKHVSNLKEFLKIRDTHPIFDQIKKRGQIGIPCFILEDGTVTLTPEEAGLASRPSEEGSQSFCSLDGKGC